MALWPVWTLQALIQLTSALGLSHDSVPKTFLDSVEVRHARRMDLVWISECKLLKFGWQAEMSPSIHGRQAGGQSGRYNRWVLIWYPPLTETHCLAPHFWFDLSTSYQKPMSETLVRMCTLNLNLISSSHPRWEERYISQKSHHWKTQGPRKEKNGWNTSTTVVQLCNSYPAIEQQVCTTRIILLWRTEHVFRSDIWDKFIINSNPTFLWLAVWNWFRVSVGMEDIQGIVAAWSRMSVMVKRW